MVSGDRERLEALFAEHFGDVLAYAVRRCSSRQDAEDVAAETFLVAWRRLREVPEGSEARLWLFGTACLVCFNQRRGQSRQRGLAARIRGGRQSRPLAPVDAGIAERQRIHQAFEALSATDREILQLHAWEQLTTSEIAIALEIATTTVRKRLQRARERLSTLLDEQSDDNTPRAVVSNLTPIVRKAAP